PALLISRRGKFIKDIRISYINERKLTGLRLFACGRIASNEGFIKRTLDYLSFAVTSFWAGLFRKADVIIATSPQFFATWSGWALSKFKRKPWIFELRDLWPESIKTVGALDDGTIYNMLEKIELFLYRSADLVVPVTDAFKENLVD